MKYLLTGGLGDIGSILYNLFSEHGHTIRHFDNNVDVRANRILHLAAKSPPASAEDIINSNILYLQEVIEYASKNNIREFVFFSAVSIYGNQNKEDVCESDCIVDPNLYGVSKLLGEKLLSEAPFNVLSIRLPAVLGVKNKTNFLSRCYMKLKSNEEIELTNSARIFNNFISVENIFDFIINLKLRDKFDVINLASKKEMTLKETVELMKNILDSKSKILPSNRKGNFFNISTEKAASEYGFTPHGTKETVVRWVHQRKEYE